MALWTVFILMIISFCKARIGFWTSDLIKESIEQADAFRTLPNNATRHYKFHDIQDYLDAEWWLETGFARLLSPKPKNSTDKRMPDYQHFVGLARAWQRKGTILKECPDMNSALKKFYPGQCYPKAEGVVPAFGPHADDPAFRPAASDYPGEFHAYIDIGRPFWMLQTRLGLLRKYDWLGKSTQEVGLDAIFANLEANIYTRLYMHMKFLREGGVDLTTEVYPIRADVHTHWSHVFVTMIFLVLVFIQTAILVKQVLAEKQKGNKFLKIMFQDPFTWLELAAVFVAILLIFYFLAMTMAQDSFVDDVANLGSMPQYDIANSGPSKFVQAFIDNLAYQKKVSQVIDTMDDVLYANLWLRFIAAWYAVLLSLRFLRGFSGQPRTAVLIQAVLYMGNLFLHYMVVFSVTFGSFLLGGYILFGEQLEGWATVGRSADSLMKVFFGESSFEQFRQVAPVCAAVWWWSFVIMVVIIMARVLSAAVLQRFMEVRKRLGEPGVGLPKQIYDSLKTFWYMRSYEGHIKSTPDEDLLDMLAADLDPAKVKKLMQMTHDRRLTSREDLTAAENDKIVNKAFLVRRGMEAAAADRLIKRCLTWASQISMTSNAAHRLCLLVAKQMIWMKAEARRMGRKAHVRIDRAAGASDRVDVKHSKCISLAKRLKRAQMLPPGWTPHRDEQGRRYLRQEETGLTSWNLPRHLV
eukprot:TRINITY_DN31129_c0_g1_i1.p1 TRINITY_DN31129_c0_g1~~TRINITY_DN31129_c0_g1_i1.p1  ORF type:complete len:694 (+),score=94.98 TRINITY_DN31129_c0_g1_i1:2-2083(+)